MQATTFTIHTFRAKAYDANGKHTGPGRWLNLIWEANKIEPGFFGRPTMNGNGEEYEHATVRFELSDDGDAYVQATDAHGEDVLAQALAALNSK